jgi:hypothetical protein
MRLGRQCRSRHEARSQRDKRDSNESLDHAATFFALGVCHKPASAVDTRLSAVLALHVLHVFPFVDC